MTSSAKILPCYGVRQFEGLTVFAGPFPHFAHRSDTIRPPISDEEGKEKWSSGELGGRQKWLYARECTTHVEARRWIREADRQRKPKSLFGVSVLLTFPSWSANASRIYFRVQYRLSRALRNNCCTINITCVRDKNRY